MTAIQNAKAVERELTPEAEVERAEFEREYAGGNCSCHISPPCGSCTHPGNPANQAEDESCWVEVSTLTPIQKARGWLSERDVPGNQSDQRAIAVVRDLLAHIEDCALTRPMPEGVEANQSAEYTGADIIGNGWRELVPGAKVYRCNGRLVIYVQQGGG